MVYIKRIISKKEYGKGYHIFCHNEGVSLLSCAVAREYPDFLFNADDIKKGYRGKPYIENSPFHFNISHEAGNVNVSCDIFVDFDTDSPPCTEGKYKNIRSPLHLAVK